MSDVSGAFDAVLPALGAWMAALPLDGTDTPEARQHEGQLTELLQQLDTGDELERNYAADVRTLLISVNQRRASHRGEN